MTFMAVSFLLSFIKILFFKPVHVIIVGCCQFYQPAFPESYSISNFPSLIKSIQELDKNNFEITPLCSFPLAVGRNEEKQEFHPCWLCTE